MKPALLLVAFLSIANALCAAADAPMAPSLQRSLVVAKQGYFPVAIRLADGRIAVVLRGGGPHLSILGRLDMVFSSDEGQTWSKPTLVVDSPEDDRNPALGQAKSGAIVVAFWRMSLYDDKGRYVPKLDKPTTTWVTRSEDGGKTWSESQIDCKEIGIGSPFGKILTLPDGTMLMNIYGEGLRKPGEKTSDAHRSYVYRSTDDGKTWKRHGAISGNQQFNETALLRLPSGKLLAAMRSRAGAVSLTFSTDEGATWSEPKQVTPASVHPADMILLPENRVLLVTGYRLAPSFGVCGVVGDKDGVFDFEKHFVLVNDAASGDCGYPSSVLLKDGRVLTVYYATKCKEKPEWGVHCGAVTYKVE